MLLFSFFLILCITRAEFLKLCHALALLLPRHQKERKRLQCRVDLHESLIRQEGLVPTAWCGSVALWVFCFPKTFGMRLFLYEGERKRERE